MPLFSEESRVYDPEEVKFMRRCFSQAALILEESNMDYTVADLSSAIFMLYVKGMRNIDRISTLASRLVAKSYRGGHAGDVEILVAANSNFLSGDRTLL